MHFEPFFSCFKNSNETINNKSKGKVSELRSALRQQMGNILSFEKQSFELFGFF